MSAMLRTVSVSLDGVVLSYVRLSRTSTRTEGRSISRSHWTDAGRAGAVLIYSVLTRKRIRGSSREEHRQERFGPWGKTKSRSALTPFGLMRITMQQALGRRRRLSVRLHRGAGFRDGCQASANYTSSIGDATGHEIISLGCRIRVPALETTAAPHTRPLSKAPRTGRMLVKRENAKLQQNQARRPMRAMITAFVSTAGANHWYRE